MPYRLLDEDVVTHHLDRIASTAPSIVARQCDASLILNLFPETDHVEYRPPHS